MKLRIGNEFFSHLNSVIYVFFSNKPGPMVPAKGPKRITSKPKELDLKKD